MQSFSDVIARWPSPKALAEDLAERGVEVSDVTVRAWRWRGIPGDYWHTIAQTAAARGFDDVTEPLLCRLGSKVASSGPSVMEDSRV